MTDNFARVKAALDLKTVIVNETGLEWGRHHLKECPFCGHQDCFSLVDERGYKCFSCDAHGDVFTFYQKYKNLDLGEALKYGADVAGIEIDEAKPKKERAETGNEKIFRLAAEHYHRAMAAEGSAGAEWFLKQRGHTRATMEKMRAGWVTNGLLKFLKGQGLTDADVIATGLAVDKDKQDKPIEPKDYYWKGAVFPVIDHAGKVISFTWKDPEKKIPGLTIRGTQKAFFINYAALGRTNEQIIVEGENDVASLFDIGIENVCGTAGSPGKDQPKLIRNFCSGKTVYLWFDKDHQKKPFDPNKLDGEGGAHHIRFLYRALADAEMQVRIIVHPDVDGRQDKDPDDYIQGLLKSGKSVSSARNTVRDLISNAQEPLHWELEQLRLIPDVKQRLEAFKLRKLALGINALKSQADVDVYTDIAAKAMGISLKGVEELVNNSVDLYQHLSELFRGEIKKADPYVLANYIHKWFLNANARFFKTSDARVWLFYQRKIYEIGNNLEFNTLMYKLTRLAAIEKPGTTVWYYLQQICNATGEPVDMMSWMHTNRERDVIFINLNSAHNKIVRITPGEEPAMIDNGTNETAVLLSSSGQIRQFEYMQEENDKAAWAALKELIMDVTPCETPQRYFLLCWAASIFMMNYQGDRALMQVIGGSGTGKSKVAERVSYLIYGENYVGKGSDAADTRVATHNPLVFNDNLENRNLTLAKVDFLLYIANSSHRPKAKSGSDTEVIYQRLNSFEMSTSIEPFPGKYPELINRTCPLVLDSGQRNEGYMHDEVVRAIQKKRNMMLSALFRLLAHEVLPNLDKRQDWSKYLQGKHAGHNKERNNEHICTMLVILQAVLKHIPLPGTKTSPMIQAMDILDRWIARWQEEAKQTAIASNTLLTFMDGLLNEVCMKMRGKGDGLKLQPHPDFNDEHVYVYDDPEYIQTFYLTELNPEPDEFGDELDFHRFEVIITAKALWTLFNRYCKNQGMRNPFENPISLGARIANDQDVMEDGGWAYIATNPTWKHYKKIHGENYWRFSKKVRRLF
ncbi:MAG: CHC2 zinc finger domain-containing protein [Actinomycetota bacterium]|nr:CHC2 zinc finger domain-containing protein [Actinomycetota bacterium]